MNLTALMAEAKALTGRTDDDVLITDARVATFLNNAQTRIVRACPGHIDLETKDATALTLVASQFSYSFSGLDPAVFHPLRLYYLDGSASKLLDWLDTDRFDDLYPSPADLADGIPHEWTRRASSVEVYPVPTSAEATDYLRLDYTAVPTAFATGSPTASCDMADADEGLIYFACWKIFKAIGNKEADAQSYMAQFFDWLDGYRRDKDGLYMAEGNSLLNA